MTPAGFRPRLWDWLFPNLRLIAVLEGEVAWWRTQWERARAREQAAVDQLLAYRLNAAPLTPPPPREPYDLVRELTESVEFARAGETE